jgi:hypothetical protein
VFSVGVGWDGCRGGVRVCVGGPGRLRWVWDEGVGWV